MQVMGDAFIKGSGATSATSGLVVQNSGSNALFTIKNNGWVQFGGGGGVLLFPFSTTTGGTVDLSGQNLHFYSYTSSGASSGRFFYGGNSVTATSGNNLNMNLGGGFTPTSGTGTYTELSVISSINQTGGANGITRGVYVQPTLTAAADWRSIEWSNNSGWGLYGAGTANNYLNGGLLVGTTTTVSGYKLVVSGSIYASTHIRFDEAIRDNRDNTIISQSLSSVVTNRILSIGNGTYLNINFPNGNVLVGTITDAGFKLDVNGTARVSGNATITGNIILGLGGTQISTTSLNVTASGSDGFSFGNSFSITATSGTYYFLRVNNNIAPTSGTAVVNQFLIQGTVNQTGGANGITRGLYVNATLTSAADFRAIETERGNVVFKNLPTSSAGLPSGAIWNDGGTLKIV